MHGTENKDKCKCAARRTASSATARNSRAGGGGEGGEGEEGVRRPRRQRGIFAVDSGGAGWEGSEFLNAPAFALARVRARVTRVERSTRARAGDFCAAAKRLARLQSTIRQYDVRDTPGAVFARRRTREGGRRVSTREGIARGRGVGQGRGVSGWRWWLATAKGWISSRHWNLANSSGGGLATPRREGAQQLSSRGPPRVYPVTLTLVYRGDTSPLL